MLKIKNKMAKRVLAFVLSAAMVFSGMTVPGITGYAEELESTEDGYYSEELITAAEEEAEEAENITAEETPEEEVTEKVQDSLREEGSSATESSKVEGSSDESSKTEASKTEGSSDESSKVEGSSDESSKVEGSSDETSSVEGSSDETSSVEGSSDETSSVEGSSDETSSVEGSSEPQGPVTYETKYGNKVTLPAYEFKNKLDPAETYGEDSGIATIKVLETMYVDGKGFKEADTAINPEDAANKFRISGNDYYHYFQGNTNGKDNTGIPAEGATLAAFKITASKQSQITFFVKQNNKNYYFLDAANPSDSSQNVPATAQTGVGAARTFKMEAGHTYYFYAAGSKVMVAEIYLRADWETIAPDPVEPPEPSSQPGGSEPNSEPTSQPGGGEPSSQPGGGEPSSQPTGGSQPSSEPESIEAPSDSESVYEAPAAEETKIKADDDNNTVNLGTNKKIEITVANLVATKKPQYKVTVTYLNGTKRQELTENVHYDVKFGKIGDKQSDGIALGEQAIIIKGTEKQTDLGIFTGQVTKTYTLFDKKTAAKDKDISKLVKGVKTKSYDYTGTYCTPEIEWKSAAPAAENYALVYKNNVNAGKASVTVIGTGTYYGSKTVTYSIKQADITNGTKLTASNVTFTGSGKAYTAAADFKGSAFYFNDFKVEKTADKKALKTGIDYTVDYKKNNQTGKATVTVKGANNYKGSIKVTLNISSAVAKEDLANRNNIIANAELNTTNTPAVAKIQIKTAKAGWVTLNSGTDFTAKADSALKNAKAGATGKFTITGKGEYKNVLNKVTIDNVPVVAGGLYVKAGTTIDASKIDKAKTDKRVAAANIVDSAGKKVTDAIADIAYTKGATTITVTPKATAANFAQKGYTFHVATPLKNVVKTAKYDKKSTLYKNFQEKKFDGVNNVTLTVDEIVEYHLASKDSKTTYNDDLKKQLKDGIKIASYKNNHKAGTATVVIEGKAAGPYSGTVNITFPIVEVKKPVLGTFTEGQDTPPESGEATESKDSEESKTEGSQTETSKTEGSQTETSKTEGSQTETSKTEGSQTEGSETTSSGSGENPPVQTVNVWDKTIQIGMANAVTVGAPAADGSVTLTGQSLAHMGGYAPSEGAAKTKDNSNTGALVFGNPTSADITMTLTVTAVDLTRVSNSAGIGFGVTSADTSKTVYLALRGKGAIKGIYTKTNDGGFGSTDVDDGTADKKTAYAGEDTKATDAVAAKGLTFKITKNSDGVTVTVSDPDGSNAYSKKIAYGNTNFTATEKLYPVIFIDGCTATIKNITITPTPETPTGGSVTPPTPPESEPEGSKVESSATESSKTESSATESSKTESSATESSKTESSATESSDTASSGSGTETPTPTPPTKSVAWDAVTSIGNTTVTISDNDDGTVTLTAGASNSSGSIGKTGSNNSDAGVLAFGNATTGDVKITAKIKVLAAASSDNKGIAVGLAKKGDLNRSAFTIYRGKGTFKAVSYVCKGTTPSDQFASSGVTWVNPDNKNDKTELKLADGVTAVDKDTEITFTVEKKDKTITCTVQCAGDSKKYTKEYTLEKDSKPQESSLINLTGNATDGYSISTTKDELYPVIMIDDCTAIITDLTITPTPTASTSTTSDADNNSSATGFALWFDKAKKIFN